MPRRVLQGTVQSNKNDKTVIVKVNRRVRHPIYDKILTRSSRYAAHDEKNSCQVGDVVKIIETKPFSKTKTWEVIYEESA